MDKVLDTDKLVPPSVVAKQNLFEIDAERLKANKSYGIAVTRDHMYEINQEAKEKRKKTFGMGKYKLANVIEVASKIRGMDLANRK